MGNAETISVETKEMCQSQQCDENEYSWKKEDFPLMQELGITPMGYTKEIRVKDENLSYDANGKLQIDMDLYLHPTDQSKNCKSWMVYNCGIKTDLMEEYDYNVECNPNELITFTLSIYHRQTVGWIIQYFLGLIDGETDKFIKIGDDIAIPLHQDGYRTTKIVKHCRGTFPSPTESGIYFVTWPC